jgi:hypothetical protein
MARGSLWTRSGPMSLGVRSTIGGPTQRSPGTGLFTLQSPDWTTFQNRHQGEFRVLERTVLSHLGAARAKLGVRSRVEAGGRGVGGVVPRNRLPIRPNGAGTL